LNAIDGETTHLSVEEAENKGDKCHGKLHSSRIDSADSGILIEEAKQEEGERYYYRLCYVWAQG